MIIVTVLYPGGAGKTFDMDYYLKTHIPLLEACCGEALTAVAIDKGLSGPFPGSEPAYAVICRLSYESVETFMGVMKKRAADIMGDIPNFTNVSPLIQISEVVR